MLTDMSFTVCLCWQHHLILSTVPVFSFLEGNAQLLSYSRPLTLRMLTCMLSIVSDIAETWVYDFDSLLSPPVILWLLQRPSTTDLNMTD